MLFGTKIYVHGDYLDPEETCMVVVNHRTRVDWNYLWLCMFHATRKPQYLKEGVDKFEPVLNGKYRYQNGGLSVQKNGVSCDKSRCLNPLNMLNNIFNQKLRMKYVLKDEIRHIPGPGWVMQMNCYTYIKRNWEQDEAEIKSVINYLYGMDYTHQLLIFPEGTDLTEQSIKKSDAFAKKFNLPTYRQVLHPRTRGFTSLVQLLQPKLTAVYDITIGYENFKKATPELVETCCLKDMITGRFPTGVHFYIKRYSINSLPDDPISLGNWLNDIWKNKEEKLDNFYTHRKFIDAHNYIQHTQKSGLIVALIFWTALVILYPLAMYYFQTLRWIVAFLCTSFIILNYFTGGFHHLEMIYLNFKKGKAKKLA
ncbi:lysocardiolipin acyltransferase 1-like isoform X2 [Arctopsyche grandis]